MSDDSKTKITAEIASNEPGTVGGDLRITLDRLAITHGPALAAKIIKSGEGMSGYTAILAFEGAGFEFTLSLIGRRLPAKPAPEVKSEGAPQTEDNPKATLEKLHRQIAQARAKNEAKSEQLAKNMTAEVARLKAANGSKEDIRDAAFNVLFPPGAPLPDLDTMVTISDGLKLELGQFGDYLISHFGFLLLTQYVIAEKDENDKHPEYCITLNQDQLDQLQLQASLRFRLEPLDSHLIHMADESNPQ